jgi:two-component system, OmpR family, sensor kinase
VGRLFWKFFLFVWLAQLLGIVAVAALFSLTAPRFKPESVDAGPVARAERPGPPIAGGPPPEDAPPARNTDSRPGLDRAAPGMGPPPRDIGPPADRGPPRGEPPRRRPSHGWPRNWPPPGPMIATLLASLLTAALLAWYVAKPIRGLRRAFEAASSGRLDHRVAPSIGTRQDELADLGREFDRMAERLQDSMSRQRRLLHDVSHEVRSPLARLHAAAGLLRQRRLGQGTAAAAARAEQAAVDRIEEEIARIDRLVGDLLELSRIEAGELAGDTDDVDLHELVSQVVSDADFEARAAGRRIAWTSQAAASLVGRAEMLHVAFENILRNALKHAPGSEVVTVETTLDADGSRFHFRVLDSGPGVRDDELGRLFTPFFRTDQASNTEGYGLGLAIARRSIEAHGGTIRAQNRPGGGLAVEIALPLRAPGHPEAVKSG